MAGEIIVGRDGNQRIKITDPHVGRRQFRLIPKGIGYYTLIHMGTTPTIVNGMEVLRTQVSNDTIIQVGPNFKASVSLLVNGNIEKVSVRHLKRLWDDYEGYNLKMRKDQQTSMMIRTGSMIFTMSSGVISAISEEYRFLGIIFTIIGILGIILSFIIARSTDPATAQKNTLYFQLNYCCPKCKKSMPERNYIWLFRNYKKCAGCGVTFEYGFPPGIK